MRLRLLFVAALATGYLLGTKAGRRRYEEIKAKAAQAWDDPRVHKVVSDAQEFVKDAAPVVQAKVSEATAAAAGTAQVAGQKMADGAVLMRERIMEAVDTVLEKLSQGEEADAAPGQTAGGEASDHATPPAESAEPRPTERPGEAGPSPL